MKQLTYLAGGFVTLVSFSIFVFLIKDLAKVVMDKKMKNRNTNKDRRK